MIADKTNKMTCGPSEGSDQQGHPARMISLCSTLVAKDPRIPSVNSEDSSDWADAQADLSLCWAHRSLCWFCPAIAHLII